MHPKFSQKNLQLILLVTVVLLLLLAIFTLGFKSIWFYLLLVLWICYFLIFVFQTLKVSFLSISLKFVFFLMLSIFSVLLITVSAVSKDNKPKQSKSIRYLSASECAPYIAKYHNKSYNLSGEDVQGKILITVEEQNCHANLEYLLLINTTLTPNPYKELPYQYNYIGLQYNADEDPRNYRGVGIITAVFRNHGKLPSQITDSTAISEFYRIPNDAGTGTSEWFYNHHSYESDIQDDQNIDSFLARTSFAIVDGKPFIVEVNDEYGSSSSIDHTAAEKNGNIVKTFTFTVTEQD